MVDVTKDQIGKHPHAAITDLVSRGYKAYVYWRDGHQVYRQSPFFTEPNEIALFVENDKVVRALQSPEKV